MKKRWYAGLLSLALSAVLTGCGTGGGSVSVEDTAVVTAAESGTTAEGVSPGAPAEPREQIFTDSAGREVILPAEIERVAVSGPLAQVVLYTFAPERLVGFSGEWSEEAEEYIPAEYFRLPVLGQLYGGKGELNLEALQKAAPDVVIDVGESKKTIREDLDTLQEQTGLPFIHIEATTETMGDAYRMLGELLRMKERGEIFAGYCEEKYSAAQEIAEKAGENKKRILYVLGEEGHNVLARGSFHAEILDMLADNVAVVEDPSSRGSGNEVDMEQILSWDPEVILFAPDSICDKVQELEEWKALTAVKNGAYYEVPSGPYNWMGFPPSVQRYLGMMWLEKILYPELSEFSLKEEVQKYYQMFFHTELTEEQYEKLTGRTD